MTRTDIHELDQRYVWHPFTQMKQWMEGTPLIIDRAEGNHLIDTDGRRYLDGVSSLWVNVHGHAHPVINEAIRTQLDKVAHSTLLGLSNPPAAQFAAALAEVTPGDLNRVFYSDSGSTAVEIALKQAYQYWCHRGRRDKHRFVHLKHAYHGDTLGAVSVGGIGLFHEVYGPLLREQIRMPSPSARAHGNAIDADAAENHAIAALERIFESSADECAALVVEPLMQGAVGMFSHRPSFLRRAAELCRNHDVLLIADEVAVGFGRTGRMFAVEHAEVVPDFLCLAKGISGGYLPLAATVARDEIHDAFLGEHTDYKTFFHGHTYTGNPLACAAAIASLELFATEDTLRNVGERSEQLRVGLAEGIASQEIVADIRQHGLMVGIEVCRGGDLATPFDGQARAGAAICELARKHGLLLRPLGDVIVLMPPLSVTASQIEALVAGLAASIREFAHHI